DCQVLHDRLNEEETFAAFSRSGQEVALHGARHIFMDKVPLPEAIKEAVDNRAYLEEKFGVIVRGMAYAYSGFNADIKRVLADLGVAYARTTKSTYSFEIPSDWLELNPTCHHNERRFGEIADKFFGGSPFDAPKHREPWLFCVWGHAYEFDDDGNWNVIEELGKRAAENKDEVWLATGIEIYDYVQAYNRLVFSLDGERVYNPSAIPVWIEIRGKTYEIASGAEIKFDK
ncbi:MAG: polysaccharide deacetylase family protein, partial [Clostridia bacterium]|nr:polysaccharide deacetylase family protein [Clostridia bacterium]